MINVSTMINSNTFSSIENILDKSSFRSTEIDRDPMLYKICRNMILSKSKKYDEKTDMYEHIIDSLAYSRYVAIANNSTRLIVVPVVIDSSSVTEEICLSKQENYINSITVDDRKWHILITMVTDKSTILSLATGLFYLLVMNYGGFYDWSSANSTINFFKAICTIYWLFRDSSCYINDGTYITNNKELIADLIDTVMEMQFNGNIIPSDSIIKIYAEITSKIFTGYDICISDDIIDLVDAEGINVILAEYGIYNPSMYVV